MGRFDHLATRPSRGPSDILRWKVLDALAGKNRKDPGGYTTPRREPDRALVEGIGPQLTWIGHATFLLTLGGKRILVDPIFRHRLGPVARLAPPGLAIGALPPIDVVLVTHNHRDHLDPWSLERLGPAPQYVVPLGNGDLLRALGAEKVIELDWWQGADLGALEVTLVPARHWSMRYPWDRNDALWGGFVLRSNEGTAYHSGDTAFFDGFAEIGRRLGRIDWAMLPHRRLRTALVHGAPAHGPGGSGRGRPLARGPPHGGHALGHLPPHRRAHRRTSRAGARRFHRGGRSGARTVDPGRWGDTTPVRLTPPFQQGWLHDEQRAPRDRRSSPSAPRPKHPHPLVCGYYSVHTSEHVLALGETGIRMVASALQAKQDVVAWPLRS
jgi:N-acyl-phosphatidylethanolamine-hydrolysing phospholipase D